MTLTPRQLATLRAFARLELVTGRPTLAEIARVVGRTKITVHELIGTLVAKGLLVADREPGYPRRYAVTPAGLAALAECGPAVAIAAGRVPVITLSQLAAEARRDVAPGTAA